MDALKRARREVEADLGRALTAAEWRRLLAEERDELAEVDLVGGEPLARLVEAWEREGSTVEAARASGVSGHLEALTLALTFTTYAEACQRPAVAAWRDEHLGGRTLPLAEVVAWVEAVAEVEGDGGPGAPTFSVPTPGGYATVQRVEPGGVLDELRLLAGSLADDYRWPGGVADGVAFLVAGVVPLVPAVQVRSSTRWVTMAVHVGASPDEVAAQYQRARSQIAPGRSGGEVRLRAAGWAAVRWHLEGWDWPRLCGRWNLDHEERRYSSWRAFRNAVVGAWRGL